MTLHARNWSTVPHDTTRAARTAFPKGNVYMTMRDELELHYQDAAFASLFTATQGRPAAWRW